MWEVLSIVLFTNPHSSIFQDTYPYLFPMSKCILLQKKVPRTNEQMHVNPSDYKLCCKSIPILSIFGSAATLMLAFDLDFDFKWTWSYGYHARHVLNHWIWHKNHSNWPKDSNYIDTCMFHILFTEHHILVRSHCVFWSVGHIYRLWCLRLSFSNVQMHT